MTNVYYIAQAPDLRLLEILGHANYADKGKDIVCSAISILTYALRESLEQLPQDQVRTTTSFKEGNVDFLIKTTSEATSETHARIEAVVDMAIAGYKLLEAEYSSHICVHC